MARRSRLGAAIDGTSKALAFLGGLATLAMTGLIAFDVLMRYFLNEPQLFVDEVVGFLSTLASGGDNSLVSGNAIQAQKVLSEAIRQVATLRGRLGALQKNVLETNVSSLQIALENVTSSESAIRDADFAETVVSFTRGQARQASGLAALRQSNQSALLRADLATGGRGGNVNTIV